MTRLRAENNYITLAVHMNKNMRCGVPCSCYWLVTEYCLETGIVLNESTRAESADI